MNEGSPSGKQRLRDKIRSATAAAILEASEAVFAEQGLHSARMDDIAGRAGVAVGTLYNYFADRSALLSALVDLRRDELIERIDQALASSATLTFPQQLEVFVLAAFQHFKSHQPFLTILMEAECAHLTTAKPRESVRALFERCETIVARGVQVGAVKNDELVDYPAMLHGCLRAVFTRGRIYGDSVRPSFRTGLCTGEILFERRREGTVTTAVLTRYAQAPVTTNKWLVTVSVTFGTLMGAIDASIVNVAVPHIRGSVGADITEITWISTGFIIATVLVMPLTGFFGRLFGQKNFYLFSLVLFIAGSALCGLARTLPQLVAFRVIQGLGAGALQPTEQAILRQTFPPEEQGTAMAFFGMAVMIGPAIGPTLGGYIVDHYAWPWIFYINLPVGLLGLFMVSRFVREPEDIRNANREMAARQRGNFDWPGIALMAVGLAALQYLLEEGQRDDWFQSSTIVTFALIALFCLAAFVIREFQAKVPVVNLRLFQDRVFLTGTLIGATMFAMLMANMFLLPLFMQELLGFTAMQSGVALMPRVLVMMIATPIVGKLYNRVSPRVFVGIGVLFFTAGAFQMSKFNLQTSSTGIIAAIAIQGIGFSCLFVPLTTVALSTIKRHQMTDATGLNSLIRQVGGSIGLAIFVTLLARFNDVARASVTSHVSSVRPEVIERLAILRGGFSAQGFDPHYANQAAMSALDFGIRIQASVLAYDKIFILAGVLFLVVLPLLIFLRIDRKVSVTPAHTDPMEL